MTAAEIPELRPTGRYEWERVIRRVKMHGDGKYIALMLSTYADADGTRVRPGLLELVDATGKSESTVKRYLKALREDYRLIEQVSRGGGRSGRGKAAEYRLVVPADLLDRVELTPVRAPRSGLTLVTSQSPAGDSDSGVTKVTSQSDASEVTQMTRENDFQGSNTADVDGLRGQIGGLRGHPGDPLPPTAPTTKEDQHVVTTQRNSPQDAVNDAEKTDPSEVGEPPILRPAKCAHGLPAHRHDDGTPTCALCRRHLVGAAS